MTRNQRIRPRTVRPARWHFKKEPLLQPGNLNKILIHPFRIQRRKDGEVIIGRNDIRDLLAAFLAAVDDHPALSAAVFLGHRFHESFTQ